MKYHQMDRWWLGFEESNENKYKSYIVEDNHQDVKEETAIFEGR